jgi:hypothetical protein
MAEHLQLALSVAQADQAADQLQTLAPHRTQAVLRAHQDKATGAVLAHGARIFMVQAAVVARVQ